MFHSSFMSLVCAVFIAVFSFITKVNAAILVCYYSSAAVNYPSYGKFTPSNINASLCTHYVYAYASINPSSFEITSFNSTNDVTNGGYRNFTSLKTQNPNAKFLIALGGKDDSSNGKYSTLGANSANINKLVASVVPFLQTYGFDGLSLDWFYPNSTDKIIYANLIKTLKTSFQSSNGSYLLGSTVSGTPILIDNGYNVTVMNQNLDFVNLITFNYHNAIDEGSVARHHAPLYTATGEDASEVNKTANYSVNYWISKGLSSTLINLGIPFFGRTWSSSAPNPTPPIVGTEIAGAGNKGPISNLEGFLTYYEICQSLNTSGTIKGRDSQNNTGPFAYAPNLYIWMGFDDSIMARIKANYVLTQNLGGAMLWDITQDDFTNRCNDGVNPLTTAVSAVLRSSFPVPPTTTSTTTVAITSTTTTSTNTTASPTSSSTSSFNVTTPPTVTQNLMTTTQSVGCPLQNSVIPDVASCKKFYVCLNGTLYSTTCPDGKYFNPISLHCENDPLNTKCPFNGPSKNEMKKAQILSYNAVKYDWKVVY